MEKPRSIQGCSDGLWSTANREAVRWEVERAQAQEAW